MNIFNFVTPDPPDLLSIAIEGDRVQLVAISDKFEQDIFTEFTSEVTRYMFPSPAKDIEETRSFIIRSRSGMGSPANMGRIGVKWSDSGILSPPKHGFSPRYFIGFT